MRAIPTAFRPLAPALVLGLVLAGCSDDNGAEEAIEDDKEVVVVDEDQEVVEVEDADDVAVVEGDEEAAAALAAAIDESEAHETARTRFTNVLTTPQGEVRTAGEGVSSADGTAVDLVLTGPSAQAFGTDELEVEVRIVDGVMYQRSPQLIAQLDVDAEWLSFDLDTLGPEYSAFVDRTRQTDPAEALSALRGVTAVAEVGEEDLDGVATTRYAATLDLRTTLEATGVEGALFEERGIDLDRAVPVHVWVDGDGLIRRYETTLDADGTSHMMTFEVLEYGPEVDVEVPPADDTISFEEAMARQDG